MLGEPYNVELFAEPGYAQSTHTGALLLSASLLPAPLPIGFGNLFLATPIFVLPAVTIPPASGLAVVPLPIPNAPSLAGARLPLQAVIASDAAPGRLRLTSYLADVIQR